MFHLKFTDGDLKANREGRLTDSQRKKLDARVDQRRRIRRIVVPIAGVIVLVLLLGELYRDYQNAGGNFSVMFAPPHHIGIIGLTIAAVLIFGAVVIGSWFEIELFAKGTIRTGTAKLRIYTVPTYGDAPRKPVYELRIHNLKRGGHKTYLDNAGSLKEGVRYQVYYLEGKPVQILSLEESAESKPAARKK